MHSLQMKTCTLCQGLLLMLVLHLSLLLCWLAVHQQSLSQATTGKCAALRRLLQAKPSLAVT
jgi:hypothetical protein